MMDKKFIILISVIIILVGFIIYYVGGDVLQQQKQLSFNQGAEAAVFTILNQAIQCPQTGVEFVYPNQTFRLHLEECIING